MLSIVAIAVFGIVLLSLVIADTPLGSGNSTVPAGQSVSWPISLPDDGLINYQLRDDSGGTVEVYVMLDSEYQKMVAGQSFVYIQDGSKLNVSSVDVSVSVPKGDYRLVVVNGDLANQSISYNYSDRTDSEIGIYSMLLFISLLSVLITSAVALYQFGTRHSRKTQSLMTYSYLPYGQQSMNVRPKFCVYCGRQIPSKATYCSHCGKNQY